MEILNYDFQLNGEMSVLQFETKGAGLFDYVSLSEAIEKNYLKIQEVNQSGSVNNLYVYNLSDKYIFMMDGDILEGAKQNRVVNSSVLVPPNSKIDLPVSCVEQGRWSFVSNKFKDSDFIAPVNMRAKKSMRMRDSLREERGHVSDQGEVWSDVHDYSMNFMVNSPTSNLSDVYKAKENDFKNLIDSFELKPKMNGTAIFIRKNLLAADVFHSPKVFSDYFRKILKGAAFEAAKLKQSDDKPDKSEAYYKTVTLFDRLEESGFTEHEGIGAGKERRFNSNDVSAFELVFKTYQIHLTAINLQKVV